MENPDRDAYRIHRILGHVVASTAVDPPRSLSLCFDDGHELTFMDDLIGYESIDINNGRRIII
jgi:hypothetical protein